VTTPLLLACLWALAATGTALLPMRAQMVPGVALLLTAPVLLVWIGMAHGWVWLVLALAGFLSMMRNPLIHLYRRARGERPQVPQ